MPVHFKIILFLSGLAFNQHSGSRFHPRAFQKHAVHSEYIGGLAFQFGEQSFLKTALKGCKPSDQHTHG